MEKVKLGRTGLEVTIAGLGCGGFSRIGIDRGVEYAASVVRAAYDAGVNFFDTAAAYGTQEAVGAGLDGISRGSYVLSTKFTYRTPGGRITAAELEASLHDSLRWLKTDYVDVFHIHALNAGDYEWAREELLPVMLRAKRDGKIRFAGVTEQFAVDTSHEMFRLVLPDDLFDVIMVGHNILNPSAAKTVLPLALERNVAVLNMFAVRSALHNPEQLRKDVERIVSAGQGGSSLSASSLDFLVERGIAASLQEAAYRFCRHTPGITVTLTGTGNREHLADNLRSIGMPKLPDDALAQLDALFGNVDCVSGQ